MVCHAYRHANWSTLRFILTASIAASLITLVIVCGVSVLIIYPMGLEDYQDSGADSQSAYLLGFVGAGMITTGLFSVLTSLPQSLLVAALYAAVTRPGLRARLRQTATRTR
jgi:hypothetical protein